MDITKIQGAIAAMPNLKVQGGKQYTMVAQRVEAFRKAVGADAGIETDLIVDNDKRVLIKCSIKRSDGFIVATGYAEELRGSSGVNRTAAIENCETSAVGRALSALGLHGGEYASIQEIEKSERNSAELDERERKEKERKAKATQHEAEHDRAVREYQNAQPVDEWEVFVDKAKRDISYKTETWQLTAYINEINDDLHALKRINQAAVQDVLQCYKKQFDTIKEGIK